MSSVEFLNKSLMALQGKVGAIEKSSMGDENKQVRIAIVGCGAIAQVHARAISTLPGATCSALFDLDSSRAESLRDSYFPKAFVTKDYIEVANMADAAIVAVPNFHHAPITKSLLQHGLHVLCEKPLAISSADAHELVLSAEKVNRVLSCGLVRRFYGSTGLVTEALRRELVGRPVRFEVCESVWDWPMSRAAFDQHLSGGGMLIDLGPHIFDLLEVWFGKLEIIEALDDNRGGVEAVSLIKARSKGARGDIAGEIFLSRAYRALNRTRILCDRGYIDVDPHKTDSVTIVFKDGEGEFVTLAQTSGHEPYVMQLSRFLAAVRGDEVPPPVASDAAKTVRLIESCYQMRQSLPEPWTVGKEGVGRRMAFSGHKKILVTGAAGSVGSRLVEIWAENGRLDQLRCMVRSYRTAARIMRFPVEVVEADLLDQTSVKEAARNCDAIIHLGVGEKAERETRTIVDIARELGIRRLVHLSTAAVYGRVIPTAVEALQEETEIWKTGEPYADEKARAEWVVKRACRQGLEGMILRPHIVYGPGLRWSAELMSLLPEEKVPILEDGGWCNLIFVDDLVEAIRLALLAENGFGKPMFVTDGAPLKWSQYISAHASLIGARPDFIARRDILNPMRSWRQWAKDSVMPLLPVFRSQEFRAFVFESPLVQATIFPAYLKLRDRQVFKPYVGKIRPGASGVSGGPPASKRFDEMWTALQLSEARLSSMQAESLLGFRAAVDFSEGLRRTASWFALYNLAPESSADADRNQVLAAP